MNQYQTRRRGGSYCLIALRSVAALTVATVAAWGTAAIPFSQKFDSFTREEARKSDVSPVTVIVRLSTRFGAEESRKFEQVEAKLVKRLGLIDAYVLQVPRKRLSSLGALPFVSRVSLDSPMTKSDEFTVERSYADVVFEKQGLTGKGVTVAVLDSGFGDNDDLDNALTGRSRIAASVNFVPGTSSTADVCGHGTHVAGIIGGNGAQSTGASAYRTFYGIARGANLVNVRVLDAAGSTKVSTVISALDWVVANMDTYKIKVVNLSLGHTVGESYKTDPLCLAVAKAWKAGIVVVVAAGNEGRSRLLALGDKADNEGYGSAYGSVASPANSPFVISVGAMKSVDDDRAHDVAATYSARGPAKFDYVLKPDLMAPGNGVISLRKPLSFLELTSPNNTVLASAYLTRNSLLKQSAYTRLSGTSMAAPVVAGAVAMMLEANPGLTPDTVKARLMLSADKWVGTNGLADPCTYGAGYLNLKGALTSTFVAKEPALSPVLVKDGSGNVFVDRDPSVQGERAIWGSSLLDLGAIWGSRAIWGSNTLNSNRALWGSSVWSNRALWGSNVLSIGVGPILLNGD